MVYLIPDLPKVTENKQTYHQINKKKNKISIGHFTIRGHGVILLLLPESYGVLICFLAQIILGLLLIKPRWDFQIYFSVNLYRKKKGNKKKKTSSCKWNIVRIWQNWTFDSPLFFQPKQLNHLNFGLYWWSMAKTCLVQSVEGGYRFKASSGQIFIFFNSDLIFILCHLLLQV